MTVADLTLEELENLITQTVTKALKECSHAYTNAFLEALNKPSPSLSTLLGPYAKSKPDQNNPA
jgi:hypothetical protein